MSEAASHLSKAREHIDFSRYALTGGYAAEAARSAYMAAYHAALAFIISRTSRAPKTHSGVRSEFARLTRDEPRLGREHVALLGWSYELKNAADYEQEHKISVVQAERAIDEAAQTDQRIGRHPRSKCLTVSPPVPFSPSAGLILAGSRHWVCPC